MHQTLTIPQHRDPVARGVLIIFLVALAWLAITGVLPQAQVQAQEQPTPQTIILIATPTLPASVPEAPAPILAAATAAPAPVAVAPSGDPPASQLIQHTDGSVSLPGSEAWMQPETGASTTNADPELQIARDAAEAYRQLPTAAPPSAENAQPVTVRRPHTGR